MSEQIKDEQNGSISNLEAALGRLIRDAIKQGLTDSTAQSPFDEADQLLNVEQAAQILNVSKDWMYDHAKKLPFTLKLGPKMLRFSLKGIQEYQETMRGRS